jgi:hypothetical protein
MVPFGRRVCCFEMERKKQKIIGNYSRGQSKPHKLMK